MKRFLILTFFLQMLAGFSIAEAQESKFQVAEFYQDLQDLTAQEENRDDGDGALYAVIKVTSDNEDDDLSQFSFDFNYMKCIKEMRDGELWLFVQRNAKNVTIRREGYRTLKYSLTETIKAGKTYRMKLSVKERVVQVQRRILQFKVTPPNENAMVKVKKEDSNEDYQLWGAVDSQGSIDQLLVSGVYLYEIVAESYKTAIGKVSLTNGSNKYVENVTLVPNFGYLEITDEQGTAGAEVYINNRKVGTVPYKSGRMECRNDYQLMISNGDLFKTYNSTIEIRQGETTKISPRLQSNSAEITIKVQDGAEIFINGISKGKGSWTGRLRVGLHDVECRLPNHVSSQKQIEVKKDVSETHVIDKPTPIEGSLYVKSNPSGAKIILDGKPIDVTTPTMIEHVMIGSHKVNIMLDKYNPKNVDINVNKNEIATVDVKLSDVKVRDAQLSDAKVSAATGSTDRTFTVGGVTFTMKLVEAGTFLMGGKKYDDEKPKHRVTITKDYYIGETEVTQALWKAVTGYSPTTDGSSWTTTYGLGDNYPAYNISYEDVQKFITKLNSMTGETFRMPTEAEWEFAARGGKKSKGYTYSGSNTIGDVAWYGSNASKTNIVKTKAANELGIYDMSGNVWEWCSDWYSSSYHSSSPENDPTGPTTGSNRVSRGGGWADDAAYCRCADRNTYAPSYRDNYVGFRLAL